MDATLENVIRTLQLKPHPEGGYFRETYRSSGEIGTESLAPAFSDKRNYFTCIYYLLTSESFSSFHRIVQDETWHFYDGSPICLHLISLQGSYSEVLIGRDLGSGQVPQFTVPGGTWFAANVIRADDYSLAGCTVAPGFDFADFEMGKREELLRMFPQHAKIIAQFTRG
jgi:predicted cupin superfamily sugar epimerase